MTLPSLVPSFAACLLAWAAFSPARGESLDYHVTVETPLEHDDGKFLWYHPRAAPVSLADGSGVLMTLQQHISSADDYYSGLYEMRRANADGAWQGPTAVPQLAWRTTPQGSAAVADVTPGWHPPSQRMLAIGCQVIYGARGEQLVDAGPRVNQTAYAVHDPATGGWSEWRILEMPGDAKFNFCRNACAQWIVEPDGSLLVPVYFGESTAGPWSVTVLRCRFDGQQLTYAEHGDELHLAVDRGLVEPSIARMGDRYFLTIRNDQRGYVAASDDGLRWAPMIPWAFDDGADFGSYNTQQHWAAHSAGLFLVYTRRGADNDHIVRHRAPLFIAEVDPQSLRVKRATERVLIPERGGELGNFGVAAINARETWATVSEGVWSDDARQRGAKGATFVARIRWSQPNELAVLP